MVEVFHEHVPAHRISLDSEIEALKALIMNFSSWSAEAILHSRLNKRPGGPTRAPGFLARVTYPEEGVIRRYFSAGSVTAWSDSVITPGSFRNNGASSAGA